MEAHDPDLMRTFEITRTLATRFQSDSQDQLNQRIDPTIYADGSPERALANFLRGWQRGDYGAMQDSCQSTWVDGQSDPKGWLRDWFGLKTLLGAKIGKREKDGDVSVELTAEINYAVGSDVDTKQLHVMVIKEEGPNNPSVDGQWGVNPLSAINEQ